MRLICRRKLFLFSEAHQLNSDKIKIAQGTTSIVTFTSVLATLFAQL